MSWIGEWLGSEEWHILLVVDHFLLLTSSYRDRLVVIALLLKSTLPVKVWEAAKRVKGCPYKIFENRTLAVDFEGAGCSWTINR